MLQSPLPEGDVHSILNLREKKKQDEKGTYEDYIPRIVTRQQFGNQQLGNSMQAACTWN